MAEPLLSVLRSLNFFKLLFHLLRQFLLIIFSLIFHPPSISGQRFWATLMRWSYNRNSESIIFSSAFFTGRYKEMISLQIVLTLTCCIWGNCDDKYPFLLLWPHCNKKDPFLIFLNWKEFSNWQRVLLAVALLSMPRQEAGHVS